MGKLLDKLADKVWEHFFAPIVPASCQGKEASDNGCSDASQDKKDDKEKRTFLGALLEYSPIGMLGMVLNRDQIERMLAGKPINEPDTNNESKDTDRSSYESNNSRYFDASTNSLIFIPDWVQHMSTDQGYHKCTNRCYNCRQYADYKRKQRALEFFYSFFGEQCQRSAIKQKKTVYRRLCKRTRRLVKNQRNPFIHRLIRIFVGNTHITGKANIKGQSFFLVHKQHSKTKQDGGENITNGTDRQIKWEPVDRQTLTDNWRSIR